MDCLNRRLSSLQLRGDGFAYMLAPTGNTLPIEAAEYPDWLQLPTASYPEAVPPSVNVTFTTKVVHDRGGNALSAGNLTR
jgi:hypothetical protein